MATDDWEQELETIVSSARIALREDDIVKLQSALRRIDVYDNSEFLFSARSAEAVELLWQQSVDVNVRDELDQTPLFKAHNGEVVNALVVAGADIEARDNRDRTPLHWATIEDSVDKVEVLINAGADIHATEGYRCEMTALHLAAGNGFTEVGLMLLKAGADPLAETTDGSTCIAYAMRASDDKLVQAMHLVQAEREAKQLDAGTVKAGAIEIPDPLAALERMRNAPAPGQAISPRARRL